MIGIKMSLCMRGAFTLVAIIVCWTAITPVDGKKKSQSSSNQRSGPEKVNALKEQLNNGVLVFGGDMYEKYVLRSDRPYHLFLMYTALAEKYSCQVCTQIQPEFLTLAESYLAAKQANVDTRDGLDVFFGVVDFDANQQAFGVHDFTSAPHIGYFAPNHDEDTGARPKGKITISVNDLYNIYQSGKKAEDIVQFIKQKTGLEFVIQRSKTLLYTAIAGVLIMLLIVAKLILSNLDKVLAKLRRKRLWMTVSLLFYGLSVSGMVYCIIREPPAYQTERNGNIKYFHPGGRQQFVVEGLIVGAYDVLAAVCIILLSQWAIYLVNPILRYSAIIGCAGGFVYMYRLMIAAYIFKNRWYTGWMGF